MTVAEIIKALGGGPAAARALGVKRTTVLMWRRRGAVPLRHVRMVSRALGVPAEVVLPPVAEGAAREVAREAA